MPGKLPPSFPYRACPPLPRPSDVHHDAKPTPARSGALRKSAPEGQTPPTESTPVIQRKQQAGMV